MAIPAACGPGYDHVAVGVVRQLGGEPLVVAAQGVQHVPHQLEPLVLVELLLGARVHRHHDGDDDISELLALEAAHHSSHALDERDGRALGGKEDNGVKRRHVHTLAQAVDVADNVCLALLGVAEYGQVAVALVGVHLARHMVGLGVRHPLNVDVALGVHLALRLQLGAIFLGNVLEHLGRLAGHISPGAGLLGAVHVVAEGNAGVQRLGALLGALVREGVGRVGCHLFAQRRERSEHHGRLLGRDVLNALGLGPGAQLCHARLGAALLLFVLPSVLFFLFLFPLILLPLGDLYLAQVLDGVQQLGRGYLLRVDG